MAWVILGIAGILEIAFAICMKWSDGFTRLVPGVLTVATGLSSVILLSLSLRALPMGGLCGLDRHWCRRHRNPRRRATRRIRLTAAAALYYAHSAGVIGLKLVSEA